ncbi:MAG: NlpC/P60 family protein, partial [Pseudonocardiaceae bacterium]
NEHLWRDALPGDLLFWGGDDWAVHHVALYLGKIEGKDYMVESPQSGDVVKVSIVRTGGDFNESVNRPWDR